MVTKPRGPERKKEPMRYFGNKTSSGNSGLTIQEKRQKIKDLLAGKNNDILSATEDPKTHENAITESVTPKVPGAPVFLDDENIDEVPTEKCDRKLMVQRFFGFIGEMMIFLPEGEWVNIGNKIVRIRRIQDSLTITLRDNNSGGIYKYRLLGDADGVNNFQYAQYTETTTNSGKELVYSFTQAEESYSMIDFSTGTDVQIIVLPGDLFEKINRFENIVRGLLWKKM